MMSTIVFETCIGMMSRPGQCQTVTLSSGELRDRFLPPFPRGYHPGHCPLDVKVKGVGVAPSFGYDF